MTCRDALPLLPLYEAGDLPAPDAALREHLARCPACSATLQELRDSRRWLLSLRGDEPSNESLEHMRTAVMARLPRKRPGWIWPCAAAAAVALVATGLALRPLPGVEPLPSHALQHAAAPPPVAVAHTVVRSRARPVHHQVARAAPAGIRSVHMVTREGAAEIQFETYDPRVVILLVPDGKGETEDAP